MHPKDLNDLGNSIAKLGPEFRKQKMRMVVQPDPMKKHDLNNGNLFQLLATSIQALLPKEAELLRIWSAFYQEEIGSMHFHKDKENYLIRCILCLGSDRSLDLKEDNTGEIVKINYKVGEVFIGMAELFGCIPIGEEELKRVSHAVSSSTNANGAIIIDFSLNACEHGAAMLSLKEHTSYNIDANFSQYVSTLGDPIKKIIEDVDFANLPKGSSSIWNNSAIPINTSPTL